MKVLTIISDEHSYQAIHRAGSEYAVSPNIDSLIDNGINFSNAYSPCPVCAPARASWFTGQYVNRIGTWDNSTPFDGTVPSISSCLTKEGVPVYYFGKTHFHYQGAYDFTEGDMLGYLESPDLGCYYRDSGKARLGAEKRFQKIGIKTEPNFDDKVVAKVLSWLDENKDRKDDWVLNVGLLKPHFPFYVKQENWDYFESLITSLPKGVLPPYTSLNIPLEYMRTYFRADMATEEIIRKVFIGYFASIKELDDNIGLILNKLKELGLEEDVAVIYTSDHGEMLGYHGMWWKCTMFEQSARIPLIVRMPGCKSREVKAPVNLVDLFPTLTDLFSVPNPDNLDGTSLLPLIRDGVDPKRPDFTFSEYHAHGMPDGMFMIRWDRYKYVYYVNHGYQLFDLESDPEEDHDLSEIAKNDERLKVIVNECQKRLLSVCNPEDVDLRAKDYQRRMKKELNLPDDYTIERSFGFVPRPEYCDKNTLWSRKNS